MPLTVKTFGLSKSCSEICYLIPRGIILSFLHLFMNFKWFCKRALLMWLCSNVLASLLCRSPNRSLIILKRLSRRFMSMFLSPLPDAYFSTVEVAILFPNFRLPPQPSSGEWSNSTFLEFAIISSQTLNSFLVPRSNFDSRNRSEKFENCNNRKNLETKEG